jgi:hypothetical protein
LVGGEIRLFARRLEGMELDISFLLAALQAVVQTRRTVIAQVIAPCLRTLALLHIGAVKCSL